MTYKIERDGLLFRVVNTANGERSELFTSASQAGRVIEKIAGSEAHRAAAEAFLAIEFPDLKTFGAEPAFTFDYSFPHVTDGLPQAMVKRFVASRELSRRKGMAVQFVRNDGKRDEFCFHDQGQVDLYVASLMRLSIPHAVSTKNGAD